MSMTPEIQREYDQALARAVVKNGSVMDTDPSFYGWQDYAGATMHLVGGKWGDGGSGCELVLPDGAVAVEDEWDEFAGTFHEGDTRHHGARVDGVSCKCGKLTGRSVRWEASVREVAEAVFVEAFTARKES